MSIQDLEIEIKHCKLQLKIIKHYLDNPSEIPELKYINCYDDLIDLKKEYEDELKYCRKELRKIMKGC